MNLYEKSYFLAYVPFFLYQLLYLVSLSKISLMTS